MICTNCHRKFRMIKSSKDDGLCGKCRSRLNYIKDIDSYRKTKKCICGKSILKTSRLCNSCSQQGTNNHRWKYEKKNRKIYNTIEYRRWVRAVKERDEKCCKICGSKCRVAAHHILPKRDYPDLIFDVNNGISLCHKHHSEIQFNEYKYVDIFRSIIKAELKLCELGEHCDVNTEPIRNNAEGVTTRDEIKFPKSAGQPLQK